MSNVVNMKEGRDPMMLAYRIFREYGRYYDKFYGVRYRGKLYAAKEPDQVVAKLARAIAPKQKLA